MDKNAQIKNTVCILNMMPQNSFRLSRRKMINTEKHDGHKKTSTAAMRVAAMLLLLRRLLSDAVLSAHSRRWVN
jgi:hypothetical protein